MICKYCGARYTGNRCAACGKVMPLVRRSTELDVLMSGMPAAQPSGPSALKTYEQGVKEGYQKGLKEGYDNGFREGKAESPAPAAPARRGGRKTALILTAALAAALAVGGLTGGLIGRGIGYSGGKKAGVAQGKDEATRAVRDEYEQTIAALKEQHLKDVEKAKEEGRKQGKEEGRAEAEAERAAPAETPEPEEIPGITEFSFPYSGEKNDPVVKQIQLRLQKLGYGEVGAADGDYGKNTTEAVRRFQAEYNAGLGEGQDRLPEDGKTDQATFRELFREMEMEEFCELFNMKEEEYRSLYPPDEEKTESPEGDTEEAPAENAQEAGTGGPFRKFTDFLEKTQEKIRRMTEKDGSLSV